MDIRSIQYFISAAEHLNFTRAAEECFITQTAMSQQIASMEKELGVQLFRRNNRNVALTTAGKDFYEQMKNVVHSYENAVHRCKNFSCGLEGSVILAVPSYMEGCLFISRMRQFKIHHPNIGLSVTVVPPKYMIDQLRRKECDIAICWPYDMMEDADITVHNVAEFQGYLVCDSNHPLASSQQVSLSKLADENVFTVNLQGMPATQKKMIKDWENVGLHPPIGLNVPGGHVENIGELFLYAGVNSAAVIVPEFMCHYIPAHMTYRELDQKSALSFMLGAGYLTNNPNAALRNALSFLLDNRIPMDY